MNSRILSSVLIIALAALLSIGCALGSLIDTPARPQPTDTPASLSPTISTPAEPEQPGLVIKGQVRLEDGAGLPDVSIYRSYASYDGSVVAITDQQGSYQSGFAHIPGDEMVTVWAELAGYTFEPEQESWRHYAGYEVRALDFVASKVP